MTFQQVIDEVWTQRGMKMKQKPVKKNGISWQLNYKAATQEN